ncbi:MAG: MFS family transporter [Pseudomonas putida]|uniref:MFS family transporter n=1 Tax=Pseudomonas putida TaxID=303 RepID=A0AAW6PP97_PSEPU|nr:MULTISPECIES: MFS family transporter [Pseudomonas]KWW14487.1 alpha-ketoglutarate permease [Pseudomonas putida]MBH3346495.1 MFS transporter [Pseudomonas putida]MDF3871588.1 MFS family transporter [Pseudomonas putida]MDF3877563.1 MFS family transporter [Pseudomonas putida]MDH4845865.1 MFS transporter [Pseudomonas sp. BN605]
MGTARPLTRKERTTAIVGVCSGNLVEWYDFFIYAYTSIYFASLFFPAGDQTSQLLATAGIFAVGFFMRPLGGWIFGYIADTRGRKISMIISVFMMCGGSLMIAVMPTYATVGVAAPVLLVVARLMQGLSVGAEYGTGATYISEVSRAGRRSFYGSFQYMTIIAGQLLALLTVAVLQLVLSEQDLKAWGWRVPFLIGALASIVVVYLRRTMRETATAQGMKSKEAGSLRGLMQHKRAVLLTFTITIGCSLYFYTFTAYMQKFLVVSVGIPAPTVSIIMASALVIFMVAQPVFGMLADKIGVRRNMIIFGLLSTFLVIPLLSAIKSVQDPLSAFALVVAGLLIAAFYTPVTGVLKADFYPPTVRALGVGLPYAVGAAMFGGSAEYVALSFRSLGMEQYFYLYVAAIGAITLVSSLLMPDLSRHGYLDGDGKVEENIGVRKFMGRKSTPSHISH